MQQGTSLIWPILRADSIVTVIVVVPLTAFYFYYARRTVVADL